MDNEEIKKVLESVDIVEVISKYIPLTTKGKSLVCKCPFHDDHDPSMSISRDKQLFKCFTCGTGGNAITFVQKYENIPFREALEKVADMGGVTISKHQNQHSEPQMGDYAKRTCALNKEVANYANYTLRTQQGQDAMRYLHARGFTDDAIHRFNFGFIPDKLQLNEFLLKKGFNEVEIAQAGILDFEHKCPWEKRLLMPIMDRKENVIGFTSRRIYKNDTPKYINSNTSEVYNKSTSLYNIQNALQHNPSREVILVEGSMDVTAMDLAGHSNTVASLGTALTIEQAKYIKSLGMTPRICYDGDSAGRNATLKAWKVFQSIGVQPNITTLPYGKDPDELYRTQPMQLEECLLEKNNIYDFKLKTIPSFQNFQEKQEYINDFISTLSNEQNALYHEEYLSQLSQKVDISIETLKKRFKDIHHVPTNKVTKKIQSQQPKNSKKALINVNIKDQMEYKKEVRTNYDAPHEQEHVTAFDQSHELNREDILKKYIFIKGPVFETTITCLQKEVQTNVARTLCKEAIDSICETNRIAHTNTESVAFLHTNTNFPHIHLQVWQKEPFLPNYNVTEDFVSKLQNKLNMVLSKPIDYTSNPLIKQVLEAELEEIPFSNTISI